MAYSTPKDVRLILQGYSDPTVSNDPDRTSARLSDAQIEYEISNADIQIDMILRRRGYETPLPEPVPTVIRNLSIDLAASLSDMTFRGSREYSSPLNPFRLRYERVLMILDRIAEGAYPVYNDSEEANVGTASVFNYEYSNLISDTDVFPRGLRKVGDSGEYAESEYGYIPYHPYLRRY